MNIIDKAAAFVHSLETLAKKTAWDWRRCPKCGQDDTMKHGTYTVHPWFLDGRREVVIQRHKCNVCSRSGKTFTYSEISPYLVRGSWYSREVHRYSVDLWQHGRTSVRRASEFVRSFLGHQERWLLWRLLEPEPEPAEAEKCRLSPSTLHRWLDRAGEVAKGTVKGQLEGAKVSGEVGVDGLWAKLRSTAAGKVKRVVLVLVDSVTGLIYPPVVVDGEEDEQPWKKLFVRAQRAGLSRLRGVTSDGASGLVSFLAKTLYFVNHQRCIFHIWRNVGGDLAKAAAEAAKDLVGDAAKAARKAARAELTSLVHAVLDAKSEADAERALVVLRAHRLGGRLAEQIGENLDAALVYLNRYNRGLVRVGPEWLWRDFRLRVSRGRNHGSDESASGGERAALVWQIYANFTPAQRRKERKRKYKRPGKSSLELAGLPPGSLSYLDALTV